MNKTHMQPTRHQRYLCVNYGRQEIYVFVFSVAKMRVVACNGIIGQLFYLVVFAARREKLEGSNADMAGGDTGQHRARFKPVAHNLFARSHSGKGARRRDAKRMHRFAHQIFAQHRAKYSLAIAATRKGCAARAFKLDIAACSCGVNHLTQHNRAPIAKLCRKPPELVTGIGLCNRFRANRDLTARKDRGTGAAG